MLWLFLGVVGGHRYYLGDVGIGVAQTLTLGGLGIWTIIDAFLIGKRLNVINGKIEMDTIMQVKAQRPQSQVGVTG